MADWLGGDFARAARDTLSRCLDKLPAHKEALFGFLKERWQGPLGITCGGLPYDRTSTCFESDPPLGAQDKRQFGDSRDKRFDCVQGEIARVVPPEGFPLAYEVLPGHPADKTTREMFLEKIGTLDGKARRIGVRDRGIPTEEVLAPMRQRDPPIFDLVGTPQGRLGPLESKLGDQPWQEVRAGVQVKLLPDSGGRHLGARSVDRVNKARALRRRQLKGLWHRLQELRRMEKLIRDGLLLKRGAAQQASASAWRLGAVRLPKAGEEVRQETFTFRLRKKKLRQGRRRAGRYLLRPNLPEEDPAQAWQFYLQLRQVEEAFKNPKGDLAVRPV